MKTNRIGMNVKGAAYAIAAALGLKRPVYSRDNGWYRVDVDAVTGEHLLVTKNSNPAIEEDIFLTTYLPGVTVWVCWDCWDDDHLITQNKPADDAYGAVNRTLAYYADRKRAEYLEELQGRTPKTIGGFRNTFKEEV